MVVSLTPCFASKPRRIRSTAINGLCGPSVVAQRDGFSAQKEFNASVEGHKNPKEVMGKLLRASDEVKRGEKIWNLGSFFSEMRASSRRGGGDVL